MQSLAESVWWESHPAAHSEEMTRRQRFSGWARRTLLEVALLVLLPGLPRLPTGCECVFGLILLLIQFHPHSQPGGPPSQTRYSAATRRH